MYNFHDILLPDFITMHLKGGPEFSTNYASTVSGREMRILERESSFQKYTLSGCMLSNEQFNIFNCFFRARKGMYHSFLIKDYADFKLENHGVTIYNEELKGFEIYKIYNDNISCYKRRVMNLRKNSVKCNIKIENIDCRYGIIYCEYPHQQHNIIINGEFDVAVRFCSDDFKYSFNQDGSILIDDLELQEVTL